MPEPRYQHSDSWGDCRIIQPREIELEFDQEIDPPAIVGFSIDDHVLSTLDNSAVVRINIERKLRNQRFDCGTVGFLKPLPIDIKNGTSQLTTVGKGRYKWRLRIVNASGHVIAQTDTKMTGAEPLIGGQDNAILKIAKGEVGNNKPWKIEIHEGADAPVVVVHKTLDVLYQAFISRGDELWHALPKMVSDILEELIRQHPDISIDQQPAGSWQHNWIAVFDTQYTKPVPEGLNNGLEDLQKLMDWKHECIDSMCDKIDVRTQLIASEGDE